MQSPVASTASSQCPLHRTIRNMLGREAWLEGRSLVYTAYTKNHLEETSHLHDGLFFIDPCPLYKSHQLRTAAGESGLKPGVKSQPPPTPMPSWAQHPMWLHEGQGEHCSLHEKTKSPAVAGAGTWCHKASCEKLLFQVSNKDACQQITV